MNRCRRLLTVLCLGLALVPATAEEKPEAPTVEEILARGPRTPNPVLSFLPAGVEGDWQYWDARMRHDAAERRAQRQAAGALAGLELVEGEAVGATAANDLPELAEALAGVGSRPGESSTVLVRGTLQAPPVELAPATEPDGSIPQARALGIGGGDVVRVPGTIGDGAGAQADFDFFALDAAAGQRLQVSVRTPLPQEDLDPIVALFNSAGSLVTANDNRPTNGVLLDRDSVLDLRIETAGTYYVVVGGFNPIGLGDLPPQFPSDPFDPASGPPPGSEGIYTVAVGLDPPASADRDFFALELRAGDILGAIVDGAAAGVSLHGPGGFLVGTRGGNLSGIYPQASPLPVGGRAAVARVIEEDGLYAVGVELPTDFDASEYTLEIGIHPAPLGASPTPARQILYLDFDGASVDLGGFGGVPGTFADLSPLAAFLDGWDLAAADEDALIDAITSAFQENVEEDLRARGANGDFQTSGRPGDFDVEIRTSRDHQDPAGDPLASRIVVGGTIDELGLGTIGIAQSVDVGNFAAAETAIVLLDLLSAEEGDPNSLNSIERAPGLSLIDFVGRSVGAIAAHEAGHLVANFHTARDVGPTSLMDRGGNLPRFAGVGEDGVAGTVDDEDVDFGEDAYEPAEGFLGVEDTLDAVSFDLGRGGPRGTLTVTPGRVGFGAVAPGAEAAATVTFGNAGDQNLEVVRATFDGGLGEGTEAFRLEPPFAPFTLAPGTSRQLSVVFAPQDLGPQEAELRITSDALRSGKKILPLAGQGGVPGVVAAPVLEHDFGAVEYSEADPTRNVAFPVANGAGAGGDLILQPALLVGADPGQFESVFSPAVAAGEPLVLAPGQEAELALTFRPTGPVGNLSTVAVVRTNDPARPRLELRLRGRANGPDLNVGPQPRLFFSALRPGTTQRRTLTLSNLGNRDLDLSATDLLGPDADQFDFLSFGLPFSLPPLGEQLLVFDFAPTSLGTKEAFLRIASNDPDEDPQEIFLSGAGAEPAVAVEEGAGDFGPVLLGTSQDRLVEILNEGGLRLRVSATEIVSPVTRQGDPEGGAEFRIISGNAPFTVSPGVAWPLGVRFEPAAAGPRQAVLRITSDDPLNPVFDVPLTGSGEPPGLALAKTCGEIGTGGDVHCLLEVTGLGPGTAPGVQVADLLPAGLTWVEDSCGAGPPAPAPPSGGVWSWSVGALAEGTTAGCEISFQVGPGAAAPLLNRAEATTSLHLAGMPAAVAEAMIGGPAAEDIPTLGPAAQGLLAALLALAAAVLLRRRKSSDPKSTYS